MQKCKHRYLSFVCNIEIYIKKLSIEGKAYTKNNYYMLYVYYVLIHITFYIVNIKIVFNISRIGNNNMKFN